MKILVAILSSTIEGKNLAKDLMKMLDLNEIMDQLARASSVRWYGHVLRKDKNNFL